MPPELFPHGQSEEAVSLMWKTPGLTRSTSCRPSSLSFQALIKNKHEQEKNKLSCIFPIHQPSLPGMTPSFFRFRFFLRFWVAGHAHRRTCRLHLDHSPLGSTISTLPGAWFIGSGWRFQGEEAKQSKAMQNRLIVLSFCFLSVLLLMLTV